METLGGLMKRGDLVRHKTIKDVVGIITKNADMFSRVDVMWLAGARCLGIDRKVFIQLLEVISERG